VPDAGRGPGEPGHSAVQKRVYGNGERRRLCRKLEGMKGDSRVLRVARKEQACTAVPEKSAAAKKEKSGKGGPGGVSGTATARPMALKEENSTF